MNYGLLEKAVQAYGDVKRRNRELLVAHGLRVAARLKYLGFNEQLQLVGLLHDVLEIADAASIEHVQKTFSLSEEQVEILLLLTRQYGESSEKHFNRVLESNNIGAIAVKYCDNSDNAAFKDEDYIFTEEVLGLNAKEEQAKYSARAKALKGKLFELGVDLDDY